MSANDDKRIQSFDSKETYAYVARSGLVCNINEQSYNKNTTMINFRDVTKGNLTEHNLNWALIPYHLYRLLIIAGFRSVKASSLFNLFCHQSDIDKIYLHAKYLYEAKYKLLIKKCKGAVLKYLLNTRMI